MNTPETSLDGRLRQHFVSVSPAVVVLIMVCAQLGGSILKALCRASSVGGNIVQSVGDDILSSVGDNIVQSVGDDTVPSVGGDRAVLSDFVSSSGELSRPAHQSCKMSQIELCKHIGKSILRVLSNFPQIKLNPNDQKIAQYFSEKYFV